MSRVEFVPFGEEHVAGAAALLAVRHAAHRRAEALLPEVSDFRAYVERAAREPGASGVAALRDGRVEGYLIAAVGETESHGRYAWVGIAGCAASDPELVRDLYAAASPSWVGRGHLGHYASVPASDEGLIGAWFDLDFGKQHAYALRGTAGAEPVASRAFTVRLGGLEDLDEVLPCADLIRAYQAGPPAWSGASLPPPDDLRQAWAEYLGGDCLALLLAERDGRALGHVSLRRPDPHELTVPAGAVELATAATVPEARRLGVGTALTAHALAWARGNGFAVCVLDWRVPNLLSSRFWPGRGFRPTVYRLHRAIDPRVAA